jgi:methylmalonyl-CoA/ethylmalonyl-CoA epimerase
MTPAPVKRARGRDVQEPDRTWRIIGLHHVAFAHEGGEAPRRLGELLGLSCAHEETAIGFVERMLPAGNAYVQLLEATGPGVVERFIGRRGPGLHHVAFEVSDIGVAVSDLRGRGIRLAGEAPRPGGMGTQVAFIHPAEFPGLLIELVESTPVGPTDASYPGAERA